MDFMELLGVSSGELSGLFYFVAKVAVSIGIVITVLSIKDDLKDNK